MMGGVPAAVLFVILEHGEIGDPQKTEVARSVAGAVERAVFLRVLTPQFEARLACGSILSVFLGAGARLAVSRGDGDHRHDQVVRRGAAQLTAFRRHLRLFLFDLAEIVKRSHKVFEAFAKFVGEGAYLLLLAVADLSDAR